MSERERMYPETSTFHFFNVNPHKRLGGDCVSSVGNYWVR